MAHGHDVHCVEDADVSDAGSAPSIYSDGVAEV